MKINYNDLTDQHQIIDIREDFELLDFKLKNCLHIPMGDLMDHVDNLDKNIPFVLMCQSSNRSDKMTKVLRAKGYANFYSLDGGANYLQELNV